MPTVDDILESDQTNTEEVISALKKALEDKSLLTLDTYGFPSNPNSPAALRNFAKVLEDNKTLTKLSIIGEPGSLTDEMLDILVVALTKNKHLTHLSLDPSIHPNMIAKFAQLLGNDHSSLKTLTLQIDNPRLRNAKLLRSHLKTLATALEKNKTLETLEIFQIGVEDEEMEALAVALENHPTLTRFDITGNDTVQDKGALRLAQALKSNRVLTHLSYVRNKLHSSGMSSFLSFLEDNETLTELDLRNNSLDPTDIFILAEALKKIKVSLV